MHSKSKSKHISAYWLLLARDHNMKVALIVISLALVFVLTSSAGNYQYLLFVQQWPKSVCYDGGCTKAPPSVFTTHGLWPANYSGATLTCSGAGFNEPLVSDYMSSEFGDFGLVSNSI